MPGFAKFMAFMNFVVACAFLYLATKDYNARRPWAYEVFRAELAIDGLPLDQEDVGPRRVDLALYQDLDRATVADMFAKTGGNPVKGETKVVYTQLDELERVREKLLEELGKIKTDDKKVRSRLRELVLPLAYTLPERDAWAGRIAEGNVNDLIAAFDEFFQRARQDDYQPPAKGKEVFAFHGPATRRELIAHLLYNLSTTPADHQRVMVVIGLKAFIREAEGQASRLREMGQRIRLAMLDEKQVFEAEYVQLVQRILALVEELDLRRQFFASQQDVKKRYEDLKKEREADKADLVKKLGEAEQEVNAALKVQGELEKQLFETQRQLGDLKLKAEEMERFITGLEVRVRR